MSGNDATDGSGTNGSRHTALENFLDQRRRVASVVNRPIDTADMSNATDVAGVADTVGGADGEGLFPTGYRADQHHHDTPHHTPSHTTGLPPRGRTRGYAASADGRSAGCCRASHSAGGIIPIDE